MNHTAIVTMFNKRRRCRVVAYGEPLKEYTPDQTLWIERSEDQYAIQHYREPFCLLYREHWLRGGGRMSERCKKHGVSIETNKTCWICEAVNHANKFHDCDPDDPHDNAMEAVIGLLRCSRVIERILEYSRDQIGMAVRGQRDRTGEVEIYNSAREASFKDLQAAIDLIIQENIPGSPTQRDRLALAKRIYKNATGESLD